MRLHDMYSMLTPPLTWHLVCCEGVLLVQWGGSDGDQGDQGEAE